MGSSARIDELRKKFDENPRRYFAPLANEYRKSGDLEQAIFICQEYLPQQPGHMSGHIVYGQALYELSRLDEARAVFETALSLDPENLIALRHLGDIARQSGDTRGARVWYQRVLEADPRNEEIAQIMMTLLATPDGSAPAVPAAETLDSTPTLEMAPVRVPTPLATIAIDVAAEPPPLPPTSTWGETERSAAEHELLDLEDFELGGVPLSSLGTPAVSSAPVPPSPESSAPESEPESALAIEHTSLADPIVASETEHDGGFDLGREEGTFEADPLAIAATHDATIGDPPSDEPAIELASDTALGLPNDGETTSTFSESAGERVADLQTFGESHFDASAPEPSAMEVDRFFSGMAHESLVEPDDQSIPLISSLAETPPSIGVIRTPTSTDTIPPISRETPESMDVVEAVEAIHAVDSVDAVEAFDDIDVATPTFEAAASLDEMLPMSLGTPVSMESIEPEPFEETPQLEPIAHFDAAAGFEAAADVDASSHAEVPSHSEIPADFETPIHVEAVTPAPAWPSEPEPTGAPSEEFITETMAELYLEQGHPEAAADIYHRLLAQRPDDAQLAERLYAVESMLRGESAHEIPSEPYRDETRVASGPTIRDFLAGLLRPFGGTPATSAPAMPAPGVTESDEFLPPETPVSSPRIDTPIATPRVATPVFAEPVEPPRMQTPMFDMPAIESVAAYEEEDFSFETPSSTPVEAQASSIDEAIGAVGDIGFGFMDPTPQATPARPLTPPVSQDAPTVQIPVQRPAVVRGTPGSSKTVSGSIDALFLGAGASTADIDAAAALSQAFAAETPEPTPAKPLQGVPAHAASSELSLDHVFKTTTARRQDPESDGFSFDQFFADELAEGAPKSGAEPRATPGQGGPSGAGDDIAQFNNWLNGLKKT